MDNADNGAKVFNRQRVKLGNKVVALAGVVYVCHTIGNAVENQRMNAAELLRGLI